MNEMPQCLNGSAVGTHFGHCLYVARRTWNTELKACHGIMTCPAGQEKWVKEEKSFPCSLLPPSCPNLAATTSYLLMDTVIWMCRNCHAKNMHDELP